MYKNEDFWNVVESVNWAKLSENDRGYDEGKKILRTQLETADEMEAFQQDLSQRVGVLSNTVDRYAEFADDPCGLGDDSFSDLMNHIVGLGQAVYEDELTHPERVVARAHKYDFAESFLYCIPCGEDYASDEVRLEGARSAAAYWATKGLVIHGKEVAERSGRKYVELVAELEEKLGIDPSDVVNWVDIEAYNAAQATVKEAQAAADEAHARLAEAQGVLDSIFDSPFSPVRVTLNSHY